MSLSIIINPNLPTAAIEVQSNLGYNHNSFQKAVRKATCLKSETIFSIIINANKFK